MWDPRRYLDTDFGLDDDESFEPFDAGEHDVFDLSRPHVMTVVGPIDPDDLGVCQPHEYIVGGTSRDSAGPVPMRPDYLELVANELEAFFTVGGRSMVDVSTRETGRDVTALRLLSQRVPVHLICSTGRHFLDHGIGGTLDPAEFGSGLVREIRDGIGASRVKPGLIVLGMVCDGWVPEDIASTVAGVANETGLPVVARARSGSQAHELLDVMERAGLVPGRVTLDDLDRGFEQEDLVGLAGRGVWLSFNRIGTLGSVPDEQRAATVVLRLAEAGLAGHVLLSQGLAGPQEFVTNGGEPGWIHLLERFTVELMEAGADADLVRTLLVGNPSRALTIERAPM